MARAARGAGAVTAPNSILAGGPFLAAGFAAVFFVAPAAGAFVAALTEGLICSAETAPQISNGARQSASLCIDLAPFPSRAPETYHKKRRQLEREGLAVVEPRHSVPNMT
jgi:hypothetical protein